MPKPPPSCLLRASVSKRLTGHTRGDLAVLDETSGTLFTGDLAFLDRTPTTPHANIGDWLNSLDALESLKFKTLIPGHCKPHSDLVGIEQTRNYLCWFDMYLKDSARRGADMSELLATHAPPQFARLAVFRDEFERTLAHLYPSYEKAVLK